MVQLTGIQCLELTKEYYGDIDMETVKALGYVQETNKYGILNQSQIEALNPMELLLYRAEQFKAAQEKHDNAKRDLERARFNEEEASRKLNEARQAYNLAFMALGQSEGFLKSVTHTPGN